MDSLKVSVIIPVYKVEQYLDRCVRSLLGQTYGNMEIILVDDGSPDDCPRLCDEYAFKYDNIKVIHQSNRGLSGARNEGLLASTGDYISFVDSDDWIEEDTISYCMSLIYTNGADAIQYEILNVSKESKFHQPAEHIDIYKGKDILQYYLDSSTRKSGGYAVCRCLFSSRLAKKYEFRLGKLNEDIDYKYKVLSECNLLVVSNQYKYHYWQGGDSLSTGGLKNKDFDLYDAGNLLAELTANEMYGNIRFLGEVKRARTPFSLLCKIAYYGIADKNIDKKQTVAKLISEHRSFLWTLLKAPIPFSRKILSILFAINYKLAEAFIKIAK
ncbi:glycosyltransferase family 2 protein [Bacteroides congonensis]